MSNAQLKARLYRCSAVILIAGLCGSVLIHLTAEEDAPGAVGYVVVDGVAYPIAPQY